MPHSFDPSGLVHSLEFKCNFVVDADIEYIFKESIDNSIGLKNWTLLNEKKQTNGLIKRLWCKRKKFKFPGIRDRFVVKLETIGKTDVCAWRIFKTRESDVSLVPDKIKKGARHSLVYLAGK